MKNIIQFGLPTEANLNAHLARRRAQYHPSYVVIDNFLDDPMSVREMLLSDPHQFNVPGKCTP